MRHEALTTLETLCHPRVRPRLIGALKRRFPGLGDEAVDDALQAASFDIWRSRTVLDEAWQRGGEREVLRVLMVASWRAASRQITRGAGRWEIALESPPEPRQDATPEEELMAAELLAALPALTRVAARRYGGTKPGRLAEALEDRLHGLETDTQVAARHGVPRECLNRAKNWIADALVACLREAA